jgi:hypothetical protein
MNNKSGVDGFVISFKQHHRMLSYNMSVVRPILTELPASQLIHSQVNVYMDTACKKALH